MKEIFAERLKLLRKEKGMTQSDLSEILGYGYTAIANYESGRNQPSLKDIQRLCKVLNVSSDYLIGISEIRNPCAFLEQKDLLSLYQQATHIITICHKYLKEEELTPSIPEKRICTNK